MGLELRPYQQSAMDALWKHIREREDNPCIVLPTGAGKGVLLARMAMDVHAWGGRCVILAHVKELLEQTAGHILKHAPEVPLGIYSAGLESRDLGYAVTVAGIQSVYDKAGAVGHADIVAIDEAHRVRPDGEGMYSTFLGAMKEINPKVRLVGFTATPYRMSSGLICKPENLLNHVCHETGVRELVRDGYLSPLRTKRSQEEPDLSSVHIRGGEFIQNELQAAMMQDEQKVVHACLEIGERTQDRKSVLVFSSGIDHAKMIARIMADMDCGAVKTIFGDTPSDERAETIRLFRTGEVKYLVNCEVLTTGFDAPGVDCVAVLRPTMSPGLWSQICGRGFRLAPGKVDCKILDFGGNAKRHGPPDQIAPPSSRPSSGDDKRAWKECPECMEVVAAGCEVCPDCGIAFEKKEGSRPRGIKHDGSSDYEQVSGPEEYEVLKVSYWRHVKKNVPPGHPPTLWVEYDCGLAKASEWVCFEHDGFARGKAVKWWAARSKLAVPKTVQDALVAIDAYGIMEPGRIMLEADGKWLRVKSVSDMKLGAPAMPVKSPGEDGPETDIPF